MAKENQEKTEEKQTDGKDEKIAELTELAKRTQANFENFRRRIEEEQKEFIKLSNANIIKKMLEVMDNFELAFKNEQSPSDFKKGMELIYAQFNSLLEEYEVKAIESLGKSFDPHLHEAMMQANEKDKEDNTIIEEFQKGYMIGNKVLRHSKVKVNKK